ncbi:C4b-binding protein beta chain isoform X2 [Cervus elaphus]|uniref:C4b-binding protein beta chain isoform X2 n=1 Tax=Cervus elaphus TaxID=9860 RepID=UPI001CC2E4B2|nr:C4b-binding protein beta chain isoform X2 [Cervus elaphus]
MGNWVQTWQTRTLLLLQDSGALLKLGIHQDTLLSGKQYGLEAVRDSEHCILKGSNWSQCRENHTWVTHFPVCKSRDCGPPETPTHGYFEGRDFKSGSAITYYCEARYRLVGTQHQQCIDGEWTSTPPICELIQEAPKPAELELEKAFLAFQESKELCKAIKKFTQRLKKSDLTMEKVKYFLERKKAKLKAKMLP